MEAKIIKIDPLCTPITSFYTIKFEGKSVSEYTDFRKKMELSAENNEELDIIKETIYEIGERGAKPVFFTREENDAFALPPKYVYINSKDFGIRLYCAVVNEHIVFLLNGDRKKTRKATDEKSNVSKYFYMANSLHKTLMKEKVDGTLLWDDSTLELSLEEDYLINVMG